MTVCSCNPDIQPHWVCTPWNKNQPLTGVWQPSAHICRILYLYPQSNVRAHRELLCLTMDFLLTQFSNTAYAFAYRLPIEKRLGKKGDRHGHWSKGLNFISFQPSFLTQPESPCEYWCERNVAKEIDVCVYWMRSQWCVIPIPSYGYCCNGKYFH